MKEGYIYQRENSVWNFNDNLVDPELDGFEMRLSAKLTKSLSQDCLNPGRLVDLKLHDILSNFSMSNHRVYNAIVYRKEEALPYFLIYFPFHEEVDRPDLLLSDSHFVVDDYNIKKDLEIDVVIESMQELHEITMHISNDKLNLISGQSIKPISLLVDRDQAFDIFDIPAIELSGRYCNEEVKSKIEDSGISGIRFEEVPWLKYG